MNEITNSGFSKAALEFVFEAGKDVEYNDLLMAIRKHCAPLELIVTTLADRFRQEGIEEGIKLGIEKTLLALDLIKEGKIIEEIAEETGLSLVEVANLYTVWKEKIKSDSIDDDI